MRIVILILLSLMSINANAQLTQGGNPVIDLSKENKQFDIPSIKIKDFTKDEIYEITTKDTIDYIIGQSINVEIDILNKAKVIEKDKYTSYLLELSTNNAYALNLTFSKFVLPEGAKMYIWSDNTYFGSYTNKNMRKDSTFHFASINSNKLIIELDIPSESKKNRYADIKLDKVGYFFKDLFLRGGVSFSSGESAECNNNVNCDEWNEWCNQIRSTIIYVRPKEGGGWGRCSGAIVNNYDQDFTPYLLTAQHCVEDDVIFDNTEVHFNYQSPICETRDMSSRSRVVGSELLASCNKTDMGLVVLNNKIPEQFNVYFAGYDTRKKDDMPSDKVVCIHHPQGDMKKISEGNWNNGLIESKWRICWTNGIAEQGSSGAPIFEKETKRIIGSISGGRYYDCDAKIQCDRIGKLRDCWHDGGIQEYLGKGIATVNLDGADPILVCQENLELDNDFRDAREYRDEKHQIIIQAADEIIMAQNTDVTFITNPSTYSYDFMHTPQPNYVIQAGNRIEISGNHTTRINEESIVRFQNQECIATEEQCGFNYFAKTNNQEENNISEVEEVKNNTSKTYPNPFSNVIKLEFVLEEKAMVSANLYNLQGQLIQQFMENNNYDIGEHILNINVPQQISQGIYIFEFCINGECERKQLVRE